MAPVRFVVVEDPSRPDPSVVAVANVDSVERTVEVLRAGGTVVLPTDTVYGLAALPTVAGATVALSRLKGRDAEQPFAVLVADVAQALALTEPPSVDARRWMEEFWPGPLTIVARRSPAAASLALGGDPATIGVRCPDHEFVRAVAARTGPIATTSANRHGEPSHHTAAGAAAALVGSANLVVDGGPAGTIASTVVDTTSTSWRILRLGALGAESLNR